MIRAFAEWKKRQTVANIHRQKKAPVISLMPTTAAVLTIGLGFGTAVMAQNLGSPPFANPDEIKYRPDQKRLVGTIELTGKSYALPNVGVETIRQFHGWDSDTPKPNFGNEISSGPTLRARLGDKLEITFLNKVDDSMFAYTFDTSSPPGFSGFGCDSVSSTNGNPAVSTPYYPSQDKYPNCFHGSSTANLHFHGTHANPDGLGDDVLVQILPQVDQPDWNPTFQKMFDSGVIPQKWSEMPANYQMKQLAMIEAHDKAAAAAAKKNGLPAPDSLYAADMAAIHAGQWPQYLIGAFPNFFEIPDYSSGKYDAGQAPGMHWYHAHKHGSTSLHSLNGMAGAFIIESTGEGGYDQVIRKFYGWGASYGIHEKVVVLQEFDSTNNGERVGPNGKEPMLVNGKLSPTITMAPGEVQLWRVLNATVGDTFTPQVPQLTAAGFALRQTAQDGVQFSPANYESQPFLKNVFPCSTSAGCTGLSLSSGNRADLLVQAPTKPGIYPVPFSDDSPNLPILFVQVGGSPVTYPNGPFPTPSGWAQMPAFLQDLPKPGPNNITNPGSPVKFQQAAERDPITALPHFMINNKQFEETGPIVDQCMPLNGLQDWVLENYTTSAAHPFHIHVNPFQIEEIDTPTGDNQYTKYIPGSDAVWEDVIAIPLAYVNATTQAVTPGKVVIRQAYKDFTGTFVLHCHILPHEDRGMMQLVRIVPAAVYPRACQGAIPHHH